MTRAGRLAVVKERIRDVVETGEKNANWQIIPIPWLARFTETTVILLSSLSTGNFDIPEYR